MGLSSRYEISSCYTALINNVFITDQDSKLFEHTQCRDPSVIGELEFGDVNRYE